MPPINLIKIEAKKSLSNKWSVSLAVGAVIVAMFAVAAVSIMLFNSVFSLFLGRIASLLLSVVIILFLWQFLGVPLLYGTLRWAWYTDLKYDVPFFEVFYYFNNGYNYVRAISLGFRIFLRIVFIIALCFAPSVIIAVICMPKFYNLLDFSMPYFVSSLWTLGNVLKIFGATVSIILLVRYFTAPILLINDEKISPQEALNLSVVISKFVNGKTISFILSFAGWAVLSLLVIPLFYVVPYFLTAYAEYCQSIIVNYNNIAEIKAKQRYPFYEPNRFR